ncbi:MAG: DUF2254 domain-containing protein [Gammaproteobacteria bacterium]|nr:DUF2254 domain-containing protein [Gammaproteobacteria bacterium]
MLDLWLQVRGSYWFLPALMAVGAVSIAALLIRLDAMLGNAWMDEIGWMYATQPDGARAILSTVAGSMITVAGVTFSMTLLAVSHASAQIGPRLLSEFMRDRGNQFTLGTFIATFLYCLVVLQTVRTGSADEAGAFVPDLAVLVALVFTGLSVMVLIYFIHHVPQSINIALVVSRTGDQLIRCADRLFPSGIGDDSGLTVAPVLPADLETAATEIRYPGSGDYLRLLEGDTLIEAAAEHDLIVTVKARPGDFVLPGQALMMVWPGRAVDSSVEQKLRHAFSWGSQRTRDQDVRVPIEQLLEILGKSMSPGVNGQYTAMLCIDQFERGLAHLLQITVPYEARYDKDEKLRVLVKPHSLEELTEAILAPMRQFVRNDWICSRHMLRMLERLQALPGLEQSRPLLQSHAVALRAEIADGSMSDNEKQDLLV